MTVPMLFGWEAIATALTVVVVVAVAFVVLRSAVADATERAEWQGWLDGRSSRRRGPPGGPDGSRLGQEPAPADI